MSKIFSNYGQNVAERGFKILIRSLKNANFDDFCNGLREQNLVMFTLNLVPCRKQWKQIVHVAHLIFVLEYMLKTARNE